MKRMTIALCLGLVACSPHADTAPSRALVMEYVSTQGMREGIDRRTADLSKEMVAKAPPGQTEKINRLVESSVGWAVLQEDLVSLIQSIYTTEELESLVAFAKASSSRGLAEKNQRFSVAAIQIMQKRSKALDGLMRTEIDKAADPGKPLSGASPISQLSYAIPPKPVYPAESRINGEEGVVRLRVLVNAKGEAEAVGVQKSSGYPRLDEAALAALARAKFHPPQKDGVPTAVYSPASVTFALNDEEKVKVVERRQDR